MARKPKRPKITPRHGPRVLGYARVSTADQSLELQTTALLKADVHPDDIFSEQVSGVSRKRPALELLLATMQPGDTLVVWKLDRLGRSLADLIKKMEMLHNRGVRFRSITEGIDTSSAMGTLLFHILGAVAQFERDLTRERTIARIEQMKAKGEVVGAPRKFGPKEIAEAERMFRQGARTGEVRRHFGIAANTIYNYISSKRIKALQDGDVEPKD
jgi:DNA invertase Pin-like site-specific DNA recombinase